jgi:hypothetical protein
MGPMPGAVTVGGSTLPGEVRVLARLPCDTGAASGDTTGFVGTPCAGLLIVAVAVAIVGRKKVCRTTVWQRQT